MNRKHATMTDGGDICLAFQSEHGGFDCSEAFIDRVSGALICNDGTLEGLGEGSRTRRFTLAPRSSPARACSVSTASPRATPTGETRSQSTPRRSPWRSRSAATASSSAGPAPR